MKKISSLHFVNTCFTLIIKNHCKLNISKLRNACINLTIHMQQQLMSTGSTAFSQSSQSPQSSSSYSIWRADRVPRWPNTRWQEERKQAQGCLVFKHSKSWWTVFPTWWVFHVKMPSTYIINGILLLLFTDANSPNALHNHFFMNERVNRHVNNCIYCFIFSCFIDLMHSVFKNVFICSECSMTRPSLTFHCETLRCQWTTNYLDSLILDINKHCYKCTRNRKMNLFHV